MDEGELPGSSFPHPMGSMKHYSAWQGEHLRPCPSSVGPPLLTSTFYLTIKYSTVTGKKPHTPFPTSIKSTRGRKTNFLSDN